MAGRLEDDGPRLRAEKPLALRRYERGYLPDPGACVDSLIVVNDRTDGAAVVLAYSDGSSWHELVSAAAVAAMVVKAAPSPQTDITALVRQAVADVAPLLPAKPVLPLPAPAVAADPAIADALLASEGAISALFQRVVDLEAKVAALKVHADNHVHDMRVTG